MSDYRQHQIVHYSIIGNSGERLLESGERLFYIRQVEQFEFPDGSMGKNLSVTDLTVMVGYRNVTLKGTAHPEQFYADRSNPRTLRYMLGEVFAKDVEPRVIDGLLVPRTDSLKNRIRELLELSHLVGELIPIE